jgi:hypothetical protein
MIIIQRKHFQLVFSVSAEILNYNYSSTVAGGNNNYYCKINNHRNKFVKEPSVSQTYAARMPFTQVVRPHQRPAAIVRPTTEAQEETAAKTCGKRKYPSEY